MYRLAPVENDLLEGIPLESSSQRADLMAVNVARQAAESAKLNREYLVPAAVVFGSSKPAIGTWFHAGRDGAPAG